MNRKIIILFLLLLLLCSCGKKNEETIVNQIGDNNTITNNNEGNSTNNENSSTNNQQEVIVNSMGNQNEKEIIDLQLGDTIENEFTIIKIEAYQIADELYPKDTSGVYMYYPDVEGSVYLDVQGTLKNISNKQYDIEEMCIDYKFDDSYEYYGYVLADAGVFRASDNYVDPLNTVDVHFVVEIPNELASGYKNFELKIGFNDNFKDVANDIELCKYIYRLSQ